MALATGDCCHKDGETPAASAVPLTEDSLSPWPGGRVVIDLWNRERPRSMRLYARQLGVLQQSLLR